MSDKQLSLIPAIIRYQGWRLLTWVLGILSAFSLFDFRTGAYGLLTEIFHSSDTPYTYACSFTGLTFVGTVFSYWRWQKQKPLWLEWKKNRKVKTSSPILIFATQHPLRAIAFVLSISFCATSAYMFYSAQKLSNGNVVYTEGTVISVSRYRQYFEFEYEVDGVRYRQSSDNLSVDLDQKITIRYEIGKPNQVQVLKNLSPTKTFLAYGRVLVVLSLLFGFYAVQPVILIRSIKAVWEKRLSTLAEHIPMIAFHVGMISFLLILIILTVLIATITIKGASAVPKNEDVSNLMLFFGFGPLTLITSALSLVFGWVYLPTLYRTVKQSISRR